MTKNIGSVMASLFLAASLLMIAPAKATALEAVNARTVAEHMDKSKHSSAEIKSYLKDLKGKEVVASGKVHEVLTGKSGAKVVIHISVPGKSSAFVVDVQVSDAGKIHKGETVSCRGEFVRAGIFGIVLKGSCGR